MSASISRAMRLKELRRICHVYPKHVICRHESSTAEQTETRSEPIPLSDKKGEILTPYRSGSIFPENLGLNHKAKQEMERKNLKPGRHPGVMDIRVVHLPERLERAVDMITSDLDKKALKKDGKELSKYLQCRHAPLETRTLTKLAQEVESKILNEMPDLSQRLAELNKDDLTENEEAEIEKIASTVKGKVLTTLRRTTYQWKPLQFDHKFGMKYLYARLVPNYSVILKCLLEIFRRDREFIPRSLYNAGSGLGSAVWASHQIWKDQIFQYYCVDPAGEMNSIASLLLQDGNEQKSTSIKNVFFRQFQPSHLTNRFSLTLSAYTLMEQPDRNHRLDLIKKLWDMTDDYLVLIENGTYEGHCLIQEAKTYLLNKSLNGSNKCNVFAPCPHNEVCPKFAIESHKLACTFSVNYQPLDMLEETQQEKYSYVILRRGEVTDMCKDWPRLVSQVKKSTKHVNCFMCCPDGSLQHRIITKKRHDKDLYRVARKSLWGDLLPVDWMDKDDSLQQKRSKKQKRVKIEMPGEVRYQAFFKYNKSTESANVDNLEHPRDVKEDNDIRQNIDRHYNVEIYPEK